MIISVTAVTPVDARPPLACGAGAWDGDGTGAGAGGGVGTATSVVTVTGADVIRSPDGVVPDAVTVAVTVPVAVWVALHVVVAPGASVTGAHASFAGVIVATTSVSVTLPLLVVVTA